MLFATYIYTSILLFSAAVAALPENSQPWHLSEEPTIFRIPSSNLVLGLGPPYPPRRPRAFSRETGNELLTRATRKLRNFVAGNKLNWNAEPREEFADHFLNLALRVKKYHEEHEVEPVTYRELLLLLVGLQVGFSEYGYRECAFVLSRFANGRIRGHIASGSLTLNVYEDKVNAEGLIEIEHALLNGHLEEDSSTTTANIQQNLLKRNESTVAYEASVQAGELTFYHVPGTHLTIGFRLAGTRLRPSRKMERSDVSRFLQAAYEALVAKQRHAGGWERRINQDFEESFNGIKLHVWGNHEQDHDWPTYQDVYGVIHALGVKLPMLGYSECIFGLYRTVAPWAPEGSAYGYGTFGFHDRYVEKVMFSSLNGHLERKRNAQLAESLDSMNLTSQNKIESNTSTTIPTQIHYHVPGTNVMLAMTFPADARIISPVVIPEIITQVRRYLQIEATAHGGYHVSLRGRFSRTIDGVKFEVRGNPFHKGSDWPTYGDVGSVLVGIYNEIEKLNYLETRIEMTRLGVPEPFGYADFVLSRRTPDTTVANLTGQLAEGSVLAQRSPSSNQDVVYPVPGTDVTLLMVHSGPPPRAAPPARTIPPNAIHACLEDASFYVGYLAGIHGGWHHPLQQDFIRVRAGVRFAVYGNHQGAHVEWPKYLDVMTVIRGLHDKLPQLQNLETEVMMYRNGRHRPFGFADFVFNDRHWVAANGTEEKQSNLTIVKLSSSIEGLNQR